MTDAAVADSGAPVGAPIPDQAASPGNALSSTGPTVEPAEPEKPSATPHEAIQRATAKVAAKNAEADKAPAKEQPKTEAKVEPKEPPVRAENGKFAAKTPAADARAADAAPPQAAQAAEDKPASTAPKWIPPERAAKWDAVDPEIRADITGHTERREREFAQGIEKYRKSAERDAGIEEFHKLAESQGTTVQRALSNYVGIEQHLRRDLIGGLEQIVTNAGAKGPDGRPLTLRDVAAHIMGQTPDQVQGNQDRTITELRQQISRLEQQVGGVTQSIQQQHTNQTLAQVEAFAKAHDRFDELSEAIQEEIRHGYSLEDAYARAERLNPASPKASSEVPVIPAKAETPPLNPAGSKSISGAPSSGSNPAAPDNRPVPTIAESLERAFKKARAAA